MKQTRSWYPWLCALALAIIATLAAVWLWPRPVTTVLIVRHAEKAIGTPGVPLNEEGHARAQTLMHVAGDAGVAAVYASESLRNQQTVQPLADQLGVPVQVIAAADTEGLVDHLQSNYPGEVVVIAGHRNTIPAIIEELGGGTIRPIPDEDYDGLFVVTVSRFREAEVLHLNYGTPSDVQ
jgi:broad specificity phosphatase PhoE